ncbi:RDD family protein [Streptomyces spiramenti]|uniref:RDD family protein n=1 Tax=Streptomyces spiramenti TaxID=2720606 RepID=A0ABX1ATM4_9ACTN|nr:RDD family protein [Streptomyces spiramenti]NJP68400.1 RDD family protein [Streptomyces spiramenti]
MSTDQPPPGPGDPRRDPRPGEFPHDPPPPAPPPGSHGVPPPAGDAGSPGAEPPPGGPGGGLPPPGGYGNAPPPPGGYGAEPGQYGGQGPLAGMPPLGSLPRRLVARIIDSLLVGIPVFLVLGAATGSFTSGYDNTDGGSWLQQAVFLLVYFVYEGLMLTRRGQTVGKMAMKIRVGMLDSGNTPVGNPGWRRAAIYSLPQLIPCLGFLFWLVNVLFCTWDKPYRQCLHDKGAKTVVVSTA